MLLIGIRIKSGFHLFPVSSRESLVSSRRSRDVLFQATEWTMLGFLEVLLRRHSDRVGPR